jgi:hypothetical protein
MGTAIAAAVSCCPIPGCSQWRPIAARRLGRKPRGTDPVDQVLAHPPIEVLELVDVAQFPGDPRRPALRLSRIDPTSAEAVRPYLLAAGPRKMHRDQLLAIREETGWMTPRVGWNFTRAAQRIGCTRATFHVWLKRYGIARGRARP